ncbi:MAG: type I restriction endonuclease subunit R [Candidatus Brocadiaceae bacterium]|nr:type I restriction endonuclease subunit R [Candidatus Brocadiaceae bacterium]
MAQTPLIKEDHISQIPALQLLQNMGYIYLAPEEALELRGGRARNVMLDGILEEQLRRMNKIQYKEQKHPFSEGNIISAVQALKDVIYDGLVRTNEKVYDLLCLGKSLQQSILGDIKSFTLHYIDWEHPENNVYHVTEEFGVERAGSKKQYYPDIVLFVNGIPFCVIECKRLDVGIGKKPIEQAISQHVRNQKDDGIPHLFLYSQILMAISKNEAKYATTGTPMEFWAVWQEQESVDEKIYSLVNKPLANEKKNKLFNGRFKYVRKYFDAMESEGGREITEQDRVLYALCRSERLLDLTFRYILFDAGEKKVARYQQYFCVKKIMDRITTIDNMGKRLGGVVWHTQGSGKSLTMVMLAKSIALKPGIDDYKIILVTDRIDLDDQIYKTFFHCGKELEQARTGKHLIEMIEGHKECIITTIIDKFEAALGTKDARNTDPNIFVLVDEGHRGQYGPLHARMKKVLTNACYIGFTGTPVMKKDKNTIATFGGLIDSYTIDQAVKDKAVRPLLYEGRHVEQKVDSESIGSWFEKITEGLTREQTADLKKKFATTDQLNKAEQKIMRIAWDISEHFRDSWQGTPFKAQLVVQDKQSALTYKKYLDEFGIVVSEVLISGPDDSEGEEDIYKENKKEIIRFWKVMMEKYGTEKEYNRQIINAFKYGEAPEIIIVVDKLITGFDAPRNTVLYLTRKLKNHTLLQAIARVNRLYQGKEFGYIIDYRGILENLDHALDIYGQLSEFDKDDLLNALEDVSVQIQTLPQKHSDLWDVFKEVKNKRDEEAYERLLADDALRNEFYKRFSKYARTLAIALSSLEFIEETAEKKINEYRTDLKFFKELRRAVQRRYAEVIDFSEYEPKIQKLIDTHVGTGEVEYVAEQVNIFDKESFVKEVQALYGDAAKADAIAHRTKKTIEERMQGLPAFYKKFSELLQEAIRAFHEERIKDSEYLKKVEDVMEAVLSRTGDDIPESLKNSDNAKAYFGCIRDIFKSHRDDSVGIVNAATEASIAIDDIIINMRIVNWATNIDRQNQMRNKIEDCIFELQGKHNFKLTFDEIDSIMDQCLDIAKVRVP